MAKQLDPIIANVLKQYGFGPDACWNCHGTWVVYHKSLEQIAAKAKIEFGPPMVVEASGKDGVAALCVTGTMGDRSEWSIGEAAPGNNKNAYPWAMAEKRAKDRVILKLIGLSGFAYSEEEADDFTPPERTDNSNQTMGGPLTKTDLKKALRAMAPDLEAISDEGELYAFIEGHKSIIEQCKRDLPNWWDNEGDGAGGLKQRLDALRNKFSMEKVA